MPEITGQQTDDIVFVERRRQPRIIVSLAARYALANRREFACRIVDISLRAMTLMVPVNGAMGERVIVFSDEFGRLEDTVIRLLERGFVMQIAATDDERGKVAVKINR